jgi:prephenate dehydrogenase
MRVAVVGLGLIGGSAALAFRARAHDRDPEVAAKARARGIDTADDLRETIAGAEIVLTAVSTAETPALLREISSLAPKAILTDTASLKAPLVESAHTLRAGVRYVAGHPMAGARGHGVEAATAELFRRRPWAIVPTARSDAASLDAVSDLVRSAGARPVPIEAKHHDRLMTWISHLPHAVAAALTRVTAKEAGTDLAALAGPGLLDTTRIAGRRLELALELALADPDALAAAIEEVGAGLREIAEGLRARDVDALSRIFREAAAARRGLEKD